MNEVASEALRRLRDGNRRYIEGEGREITRPSEARRQETAQGQKPFAIVLGCSDSRVPAEVVFDQGLGELFVIRVAGNVVAPSQIGSVEFAAEMFGTSLVVVLGHTACGAVSATIDQLRQDSDARSENLQAIVDRVRPAVEPLLGAKEGCSEEELLARATRANIGHSVEKLKNGSDILAGLLEQDRLIIVGAEYSLESGEVTFLDDS